MKMQLMSFLKLLKSDKVKDVRDIVVSVLKLLNESEKNKRRRRAKSPMNDVEVNINKKDDDKGDNMVGIMGDNKIKQQHEEEEQQAVEGVGDKEMNPVVESIDNDINVHVNVSQYKYQQQQHQQKQEQEEKPVVVNNKLKHINSKTNAEMISTLLSQMNALSSKQIQLLDTISQLQNDTQSQINTLNNKITSLESTLSSLSNHFGSTKSKPAQPDINTFFKQALSQENTHEILSLLSKTPLNQIKNVNVDLIEETIERLIPLLSKGDEVKQIISFYKTVLLALRLPLRSKVVQHVKDVLEYVTRSGVDGGYGGDISEEEMIDISIILSSLIESK